MNLFIIGVNGISMQGIAKIMSEEGHNVFGFDDSDEKLKEIKYSKCIPKNTNLIVYSSAVKKDHPLRLEGYKQNIPQINRTDFFIKYMPFNEKKILIAGAHGKTTTSAMIAYLLGNKSYYLGGKIVGERNSCKFSKNTKYTVIETDESDGSFIKWKGDYKILLNFDYEHMIFYKTKENIKGFYRKFVLNDLESTKVIINNEAKKILNIEDHKNITVYSNEGSNLLIEKFLKVLIDDDSRSTNKREILYHNENTKQKFSINNLSLFNDKKKKIENSKSEDNGPNENLLKNFNITNSYVNKGTSPQNFQKNIKTKENYKKEQKQSVVKNFDKNLKNEENYRKNFNNTSCLYFLCALKHKFRGISFPYLFQNFNIQNIFKIKWLYNHNFLDYFLINKERKLNNSKKARLNNIYCNVSNFDYNIWQTYLKRYDFNKILPRKNENLSYISSRLKALKNGISFEINKKRVFVPLLGKHNASNFCAVYSIFKILNKTTENIKNFPGIEKRMQKINYPNHFFKFFLDYGHHPNEIKAVLSALNDHFSNEKFKIIFEPHKPSRILDNWNIWPKIFENYEVYIYPVFIADEKKLNQTLKFSTKKFIDFLIRKKIKATRLEKNLSNLPLNQSNLICFSAGKLSEILSNFQ